jgi:hypothetical protein
MKVLIKAGTRAWMIKDGVDAPTPFIFPKNTMVEVERGDRYWYTIKEEIADFPETHANIIINEVYIASNPPCPRN